MKNQFDVTICERLKDFFCKLPSFESLCLSHCNIGAGGLKMLCDGLKGNHTVTYLDLGWNNISNDDMIIIIDMLKNNHALEKLLI